MQPITYATWKDIPSTWIYTEKDEVIKLHAQQAMVKQAKEEHGVNMSTYSLPSGHSPFLNMPARVADCIVEVIKENNLCDLRVHTASL